MRPKSVLLIAGIGTCLFGFTILQLLSENGDEQRVRIVRPGGALMAIDQNGLEQLNLLYAVPKDCKEGMQVNLLKPTHCFPAKPRVPGEPVPNGVIQLAEGTKAVIADQRFLLPGGRLVEPYRANTYDMARDGAIEVEKIKITQPPNEGLEGWVQPEFLFYGGSPPL